MDQLAPEYIKRCVVANKIDLVDDRVVSKEKGQAIANKYDMQYIEASALTGDGCLEAFEGLAATIVKHKI